MVTGGLLQLVAYGAQDNYLTGDPQITFFNVIYKKDSKNINNDNIEDINVLKAQIKLNDINSMYNLAEYYLSIRNYIKMLKYYILYVKHISKSKKDTTELQDVCLNIDNTTDKLQDIIYMCKTKKNIKELGELGDVCLDIMTVDNSTDECAICLDGFGKYKTECCKQFVHYNCLHSCKSCPFCRNESF